MIFHFYFSIWFPFDKLDNLISILAVILFSVLLILSLLLIIISCYNITLFIMLNDTLKLHIIITHHFYSASFLNLM